jgi:hypothetical protein
MSETLTFPTLRPRRARITHSDGLTEIAMPEQARAVALQTVGLAYLKLKALHGGDGEEAVRRIIAWIDVIENKRCCND